MKEHGEPEYDEKFHNLHNDVGHCLHVISMATEILKNVRDNDQRFNEVCETIEKERRTALTLVDEFLNGSCIGCGHRPE